MSEDQVSRPMTVGGKAPPPGRQSLHPSMTVHSERPAPKPGEPKPESTLFPPGLYQSEQDRTVPQPAPQPPVAQPPAPPAPLPPQAPAPMPEIIGAPLPPPPAKITGQTVVNDRRAAARPPEVPIAVPRSVSATHVPLTLPSAGVFYPWTDFHVRPFGVRELAGLARARKAGNISHQLDVLDGCMTRNIRELTIPDLRFVMYWLKLNSYMRTPFNVEWTSKYGNLNLHEVKSTDLVIDVLEMSRAEADRWRAYGISPARVRDMEIFETETLDDETRWLYERAQFMDGATLDEKISNLELGGIDVLERIREFDESVRYGVEESFTARDAHFKPDAWIARLKEEADEITRRMKIIVDPQMATSMAMRIQDITDEVADLEARVAAGEEVVADEEKRIMNINFDDFFSGV